MKKIISVILALSITVLQFTALTLNVGAVANNGETVIIDDDFESDKTWGNAGYIYSWINPAERVDMGGAHKNVAKISRDESGTNWVNAFGKSFNKAYKDGEVLISFDTYVDSYSRFGDNNAQNRSYMFLNFYQNTVASYNDFAAQEKRTPFALDYKSVISALGLGAIDMSNKTNGIGENVKVELKKWYHVDVSLEFGGSVKAYIDGVKVSEMATPEDFTSFGAIAFSGQLNGAGTDFRIDNLKATHNPDPIKAEKTTVNETEKYIDILFNRTLLKNQELNSQNVFIRRCGSIMSEVSVSGVEIIESNILRVKYTGDFLPGREYKVITTEGILDVFGNKVILEEVFNAASAPTNKKNITIDFENVADGTLPDGFSEDKNWTGASFTYSDGKDGNAIVFEKKDVTAGTHIYPVHSFSGLNNKKGKLTYSLDTYLNSKDTAPGTRFMINGSFYLCTTATNTGVMTWNNSEKIATLPKDTWVNLKFVFDYADKTVEYYIENELVKTAGFEDIVKYGATSGGEFTGDFSSLHFVTWIAKGQNSTKYFDNVSVSYEEVTPVVKSVRYYDLAGNEFTGDQLDENSISKIKIAFNTQIKSETLNSNTVTLKDSKGLVENIAGAYDADENVYTLTVNNEGTLEVNPAYTLTVASDVSDLAGLKMSEDIVYSFAVGTAGITGITGYESSYTVGFGTKFSELPTKLTGLYAGGTAELSVKWIEDGYYSKTPGTYVVSGEVIAPDGYVYNGENIKVNVTVLEDDCKFEPVKSANVRKNIGEVSPLSTGTLSATDSVQLGISSGAISIKSDEFKNPEAAFDSKDAKDTGASTKTVGDGEIEIIFNESYDGLKTLDNIKLMFNKTTDNKARWNLEMLYKNSDGEWIVFFKDNTDFKSSDYENGAYKNTNFTSAIYPTLIINNLSELTDISGLKIRFSGLAGGYELYEADINMKDDGNVISQKRREIQNPIRFANMFSDGAVIQRDEKITVWGYGGDNGDRIKVEIKDNSGAVVRSGEAVSDGRIWETLISDGIAGSLDKYTITAQDTSEENNKAIISDILFGDVFIASGQSNMGYGLGNIYNRLTALNTKEALDYRDEIASMASETLEGLRFFNQSVTASSIDELEDTYTGKWYKNGNFHGGVHNASAVAYFFVYDLYKNKLNEEIPVAFVESARGGSGVKAWLPEESYEELFGEITDFNRSHYSLGGIYTGCYNAVVAPLEKHNFKGVIWYQGEGDHAYFKDYDEWFLSLTEGWKERFNDSDMTFTTVQLASWAGGNSSKFYPEIRQTQMQIWQGNEDFVDMVTAIDVGENDGVISATDDIHPLYKTPVGVRLSNVIAKKFYGLDLEAHGPLFDSVKKTNTGLEITFTHADGLKPQIRTAPYKEEYSEDNKINCLEISKDGVAWEIAQNTAILGNKLMINCDETYNYVRYAWSDYPENPNLYNSANLPAFPFLASLQDEHEVEIVCEGNKVIAKMNLQDKLKLSGKLFVAVYDKVTGTMKRLDVKEADFVLNDECKYSYDLTVDLNTETAKAIFVDGMINLTPLAIQGD